MGIFSPDDFKNRPYEGGMNQALHHVFGSALVGWSKFCVTENNNIALFLACALFVAWELYQKLFQGATRSDFFADVTYWFSGALVWFWLLKYNTVTGAAEMYPTIVLCIWAIEFTRLNAND